MSVCTPRVCISALLTVGPQAVGRLLPKINESGIAVVSCCFDRLSGVYAGVSRFSTVLTV